MLLMVEKGITRGICHCIYRYAKANNQYMKDYDKNKESSYIQYCNVNHLYGWVMSQKLPVSNFETVKDTCQFNEGFMKNYNKKVMQHISSKLIILKNYMNFIMIEFNLKE